MLGTGRFFAPLVQRNLGKPQTVQMQNRMDLNLFGKTWLPGAAVNPYGPKTVPDDDQPIISKRLSRVSS